MNSEWTGVSSLVSTKNHPASPVEFNLIYFALVLYDFFIAISCTAHWSAEVVFKCATDNLTWLFLQNTQCVPCCIFFVFFLTLSGVAVWIFNYSWQKWILLNPGKKTWGLGKLSRKEEILWIRFLSFLFIVTPSTTVRVMWNTLFKGKLGYFRETKQWITHENKCNVENEIKFKCPVSMGDGPVTTQCKPLCRVTCPCSDTVKHAV